MSAPSSVPSRPTGSTAPDARSTSGSGCPPHASVTRAPPVCSWRSQKATVQKRPSSRASVSARCRCAQDGGRARLVRGGRAQRVARERGDRRRLRALAADVADQRRDAAVARREDVVEVAADLDPLAGRDEPHGDGEPGQRRDPRRQQRALQHLGDVALARVGLGLGDRDRGELAELGEDRLVARRERPARVVGHLERAERPAGAAQHHADRRRRRARAPARSRAPRR